MGPRCVNGVADGSEIAKQFAQHFAIVCTNNCNCRAAKLKSNYMQMRTGYCGRPDDARYCFDVELVESVIFNLKEHLRFSHCLLSCVLSKLYNFCVTIGLCASLFWSILHCPCS